MSTDLTAAGSVYVHVPFCARRCSYCDFAIAVRKLAPTDEFIRALNAEIDIRHLTQQPLELDTLYFGGGTPSMLGNDGVEQAVDAIRRFATIAADAEVTLEANPEDITADAVRAWKRAGINRLSIGVQSFDDEVLRWMHRTHDAASALRAINVARDGGLNAFSVDLIFALPTALNRDWQRDVARVLALDADHVSMYGLTIEPHTPLGRWHERGEVVEASEEHYEQDFLHAHRALMQAGYQHYEVSNFARRGKRARHNSAYWQGVPYIGLGPSAHGYDGHSRRWNVAQYAEWVARTANGADPVHASETLTDDNRIAETVYLGLRTTDGLRVTAADRSLVDRWVAAKGLEWVDFTDKTTVRCTIDGWMRLDTLAADLTALRSHS